MTTGAKRVIFVLDSYWPNQDGVSTVVQYLSEGLAKKGYIVEVLANAKDRKLPKEEVHEGVFVKRFNIETKWPFSFKAMNSYSDIQAYRREIELFNPDAVIVESLRSWTNDWFVRFANDFTCTKILHLHSDILDYREYGLGGVDFKIKNWGNILYQIRMQHKMRSYWKNINQSLDKYDEILYLTPNSPGIEKYRKVGKAKTCLLENAVDDIFFTPEMQHCTKEKNICRFLCVANYMERKNQGMLIEAYQRAAFSKKTELIFVGNGSHEYMQLLREKAQAFSSDDKDICFYRGIERKAILELYQKADILVLSSLWEASAIVLREAAACGMGIISTDVGDARNIDGCQIVHTVDEMRMALEKGESLAESNRYRVLEWANNNCRRSSAISKLEECI